MTGRSFQGVRTRAFLFYNATGLAQGINIIIEVGTEICLRKWARRDYELISGGGLIVMLPLCQGGRYYGFGTNVPSSHVVNVVHVRCVVGPRYASLTLSKNY